MQRNFSLTSEPTPVDAKSSGIFYGGRGSIRTLATTGNILFCGKSGFVPAKTKGVRYADDPDAYYFLIKELIPGFSCDILDTYKGLGGYLVCEKNSSVLRCLSRQKKSLSFRDSCSDIHNT